MGKEPEVKQPTIAEQMEYLSLRDNDATEVRIIGTKKKYKLRWLRYGQLEKLGRIILHKKKVDPPSEEGSDMDILDEVMEDGKLACKASAVYLLDGFLKLKLFYWIVWRWFYYVKEYSVTQLSEILSEGKKKIPLAQFYAVTMLLTEARDTLMMMTMREVEHILQEQNTERSSATANNSSGSSSQGTTSSE